MSAVSHSARIPSPLKRTNAVAQTNNTILEESLSERKDLSFLLGPGIYGSVSQNDIPATFQTLSDGSSLKTEMVAEYIERINALLRQGDYLSAARTSAIALTNSDVSHFDSSTILQLLEIRLSCLELVGSLAQAAQESKALEDLNSAFYYVGGQSEDNEAEKGNAIRPVQRHIMPFSLRLQATRLQAIGFSDLRRGVSALYEIALECRDHLSSPLTLREDRILWTQRLEEVGIRVVNSLIELGDLECARRTLLSQHAAKAEKSGRWLSRVVLLLLRIGDVSAAEQVLARSTEVDDLSLLLPLIQLGKGEYQEATSAWEAMLGNGHNMDQAALIKQNLAVAYLYIGRIRDARRLLEDLIEDGQTFQSLTFNLATLYDLNSDKARDLKLALAGRIAARPSSKPKVMRTNADFKL